MYQRIVNKLDVEILEEELKADNIDSTVINRIRKLVAILDKEYGSYRGSSDMGGYILFFSDVQVYEKSFMKILDFYHLEKDLFEYSECISTGTENSVEWWETMYLLSSDDALVFLYPRKVSLGK